MAGQFDTNYNPRAVYLVQKPFLIMLNKLQQNISGLVNTGLERFQFMWIDSIESESIIDFSASDPLQSVAFINSIFCLKNTEMPQSMYLESVNFKRIFGNNNLDKNAVNRKLPNQLCIFSGQFHKLGKKKKKL